MKIRMLAFGSRGDVQPYVALGLGLQQAGYDVTIATMANFKAFVEERGLPVITSTLDMKNALKGGQRRKAKWELFRMLLDETMRLSEGADVLIYAPAAILSAPHVAEKLGIPAFPAQLQPYMNPTREFPAVGMPQLPLGGWYNRFSYTLFEYFVWLVLKGRINKWRQEELGLPPQEKPPFTALREQNVQTLYGISPSVFPKPPEWCENVHMTGYWFLDRPADWQPPTELVDFLEAGPPPVYVGFGSMASRNPEHIASIVLEAVQQAGVRAVLSSGWGGLSAANVPDSVSLIESVPHDWLFPRMAAVVHHGGAGTVAAGLRAGKPTIVVPFGADQPFWGQRIKALGVGPKPLPHGRLTAEKLAYAIRVAVEHETMQARAAALGAQIRAEDGVATAVQVIKQVIPQPAMA